MRRLSLPLLTLLLAASSPVLAQGGPPPARGPAAPPAAGPKPGPMMGGMHGPMHEGGMHEGGMHEGGMHEGCDGEHCPFMNDDDDDDRPGMNMRRFEHMADELNLSDAVRKNVKDVVYEAMKQGIALGADLAQAKLELKRLLEQDKPDTDAVLKQVEKVGQLRTEVTKLRVRTMLKIQGMLSPEQRKKLRQHPHGRMALD